MGWCELRSLQVSVLIVILSVVSSVGGGAATEEYSSLIRSEDEVRLLFLGWKVEHGKSYKNPEEEAKRFEIFSDNLRYIDERNHPKNNHSFTLGLNSFADLTHSEYLSMYTSPLLGSRDPLHPVTDDSSADPWTDMNPDLLGQNVPHSVDWRARGVVGPVKNQGGCSSCWAFTAVATVEALNAIFTGSRAITLSEQEIIDCDSLGTHCKPGRMENAYNYIIRNGGISRDASYPYRGVQMKCMASQNKVGRISGYALIRRNREDIMKLHVARQPIGVAVAADGMDFRFYKGGVFDASCGVRINHAVTIVGYGHENGKNYWLIKNSWGRRWGEAGYIKLRRNTADPRGKCGVAMDPIYPIKTTLLEQKVWRRHGPNLSHEDHTA